MYVNGNVTVNGTITGTFSGNVTGNCSGSSGSCTGNAATATNATELNGQLASYYAAASSLPNQALNTTSDAVFDSVLCTNASAAIKIGVYGGATYLAINGNYTIGSTVYNVLNTYGNPLYITGTSNPIVYINGNLTVTGTISGSIAWNGGTITNSFYVSYSGTNRLWCSGNWSVYTLYLSAASSTAYPLAIGDTNNDWPPISWFDAYGSLYLGSLLRIGPRGTGANNTGYPEIFCRTDSIPGCTIQLGASGQRLDVVDYGWTVDLLLLDQSGNMTISNGVTGNNYGSFAGVNMEKNWSSTWSDCTATTSILANDTGSYKCLMILGNYSAGSGRRVGIWDFLTVNGSMNVTSQCEASNFWVSGSWLNSSSTLYIGGSSGAYVTIFGNGSFDPTVDNSFGLGSGGNAWQGVVAYTLYTNTLIPKAGYGYPVTIANGGVGGQLAITNTNAGYSFTIGPGDSGAGGNILAFGNSSNWALMYLSSGGTLYCSTGGLVTSSISCSSISIGGNILPSSGGSYYCGSYSYPWQIVDTQYLYCNIINSLTTGITIYGGGGSCGTSSSYWNYVYSAYIYYIHAPSAFNELLHDEFNEKINFDLIRKLKLKGDTIDPDCIGHLKNKDGFYESSTMDGWHLCVQQLIVKKLDEQEIINDELKEELDKARARIDELQLRIDELTLKIGGD